MVVLNVLPTDMGVPLSSSTYCFIIKLLSIAKIRTFSCFSKKFGIFFVLPKKDLRYTS